MQEIIISLINITMAILTIVYYISIKKTKSFIGKNVKTPKAISYSMVVLNITKIILLVIMKEHIILVLWNIFIAVIWIIIFGYNVYLSKIYNFMKRTETLEEVLDNNFNNNDNNKSK